MTKPLVALLSGAGISTDSGIPDYRGPSGLWRKDPEAEKLVTYEYYMGDPGDPAAVLADAAPDPTPSRRSPTRRTGPSPSWSSRVCRSG
ncbi:NAD-dependent protein deacetylase [Streptomyces hirsutus]